MRRTLPRKTDLATLPDDRFTQLVQAYNNTPRKCLGYNTPAETFWNQVLHFKWNPHPAFAGMTNWGAGTIHFRTNDELGGRNDELGGANDGILGGPAGWDLWWRWRRLLG